MTRVYNPDRWIIMKISKGDKSACKVLGGWSGGYLDGDSWRLSSGLKEIEEDGDYYLMKNYSGSVYKCHKDGNGFNVISGAKFEEFKELAKSLDKEVEEISVDDFLEMDKKEVDIG